MDLINTPPRLQHRAVAMSKKTERVWAVCKRMGGKWVIRCLVFAMLRIRSCAVRRARAESESSQGRPPNSPVSFAIGNRVITSGVAGKRRKKSRSKGRQLHSGP